LPLTHVLLAVAILLVLYFIAMIGSYSRPAVLNDRNCMRTSEHKTWRELDVTYGTVLRWVLTSMFTSYRFVSAWLMTLTAPLGRCHARTRDQLHRSATTCPNEPIVSLSSRSSLVHPSFTYLLPHCRRCRHVPHPITAGSRTGHPARARLDNVCTANIDAIGCWRLFAISIYKRRSLVNWSNPTLPAWDAAKESAGHTVSYSSQLWNSLEEIGSTSLSSLYRHQLCTVIHPWVPKCSAQVGLWT